jgi:hypothetical protein
MSRPSRFLKSIIAATSLVAFAHIAAPANAGNLEILLDRAQVFNIPIESKTLIIGNPTIADVSIVQPGLMVITGKAFGLTNLVSLDKDGKQLANTMISVRAPTEQMVTVMRGEDNQTLHCPSNETCSNTITLGDGEKAFSKLIGQVPQRQGAAAPAAAGAAAGSQ